VKKRTSSATESRLSVHVILVDGPTFFTIGPESEFWKGSDPYMVMDGLQFVRLRPPPDVPPEDVAKTVRHLEKKGCEVQVENPTLPQVVLDQASAKYEDKDARETIEHMVTEVNTRDRDALWKFTQEIMSEVGL